MRGDIGVLWDSGNLQTVLYMYWYHNPVSSFRQGHDVCVSAAKGSLTELNLCTGDRPAGNSTLGPTAGEHE